MREHILDYSDFISEHHSSDYDYDLASSWFEEPGFCPYCRVQATELESSSWQDVESDDSAACWYGATCVYSCDCGWWDAVDDEWTGTSSTEGSYKWRTVTHGIVRRYAVDALDLPLSTLRRELRQRPQIIHDLHHRKMEQLVGAVLSDFFDCEVSLCGRSHDGGVDLLLVRAKTPIAVQVKRRNSDRYAEPVNLVREFLGATLLKGLRDAVYVTTADHFTREARAAAGSAITNDLVTRFDLVDRQKFLEIIASTSDRVAEPWKKRRT